MAPEQNISVRVIGVIDLKDGQAVHARGGQRAAYSAITEAAGTSIDGNPARLAQLYQDSFGLQEVYVADLNAIAGNGHQDNVIRNIGALGARLIVDAGVVTSRDVGRVFETGAQTAVVGLETLPSFEALEEICRNRAGRDIAFSLDLRSGVPVAANAALANESPGEIARRAAAAGVHSVIVLDLARVGSGTGPDVEMLRRIRTAVPAATVLAGGGVRGLDDLRQLARIGCNGALVATALHDQRLTAADVAAARDF